MPLVFVHGVGNRLGPGYAAGVAQRDALFEAFALAPYADARVLNPFWGDLGGLLRWNGASVPLSTDAFEALGAAEDSEAIEMALSVVGLDASHESLLLSVARTRSLATAVDLLWALAPSDADPVGLAALGARAATYVDTHNHPGWIADVANDDEFMTRLDDELATVTPAVGSVRQASTTKFESMGPRIFDRLRGGASRLKAAAIERLGDELSDRLRPAILPGLTRFLGDVFAYLHTQESASAIRARVAAAFDIAATLRSDTDPLIIVGHSLGSIISYDMLTSSHATLDVDLLATVGSQISLFEEMKLFERSDTAVTGPNGRVPRPIRVKRWINVFDLNDLLGFKMCAIFDGVDDMEYRTDSLLGAHSAYFKQPTFHQRFAARVHNRPLQ